MIEYDKANVTSSYPSLTEYEVATVLDKAYNALIAQKVTGNNLRRVGLEGDLKAITDIHGLVKRRPINLDKYSRAGENLNMGVGTLPPDYLYFVSGNIYATDSQPTLEKITVTDPNDDNKTIEVLKSGEKTEVPMDTYQGRRTNVKFVNHQIAEGFISSASNLPWVKIPVVYIEEGKIYVVHDPLKTYQPYFDMSYIKTPNKFAKDISKAIQFKDDKNVSHTTSRRSYFDCFYEVDGEEKSAVDKVSEYKFECNDTVAEELISLAVAFALENVESQRLNSKLNMRGLEA